MGPTGNGTKTQQTFSFQKNLHQILPAEFIVLYIFFSHQSLNVIQAHTITLPLLYELFIIIKTKTF